MTRTAIKWHTSKKVKGVRWYFHPVRKYQGNPDCCFGLRKTINKKLQRVTLGWASEGWTEERAIMELSKLVAAYRTGEGDYLLAEKRRKAEEKRDAEWQAARNRKARNISFTTFWEKHYWPAQAHKAEGSRVSEQALYNKWICPHIGKIPLGTLQAKDIETVSGAMLAAGRAPSTMKYALAVISQVWTLAKRDGLVSGDSPTKLVTLPKRDNRRERFLSEHEAALLLEKLQPRSQTAHDMAVLALYCGLRLGEIASLTWNDIVFEQDIILIRDPKAKVNRQAFLVPSVRDVLERRLQERTENTGLLFPDKHGRKVVKISKTFTRLVGELFNQGIDDNRQRVCFHTLRHTYASWLVQRGVDLYSVKELMGHSDFKMTQRYSHLSPDGLRKAAAVIEG